MTDLVKELADHIGGIQTALRVGFILAFLLIAYLLVVWWHVTVRVDNHDGDLADIRGDIAAIAEHLDIEITDTDEIPVVEKPRPAPGPRTVPTHTALTPEAVIGDSPELVEYRQQLDKMYDDWVKELNGAD